MDCFVKTCLFVYVSLYNSLFVILESPNTAGGGGHCVIYISACLRFTTLPQFVYIINTRLTGSEQATCLEHLCTLTSQQYTFCMLFDFLVLGSNGILTHILLVSLNMFGYSVNWRMSTKIYKLMRDVNNYIRLIRQRDNVDQQETLLNFSWSMSCWCFGLLDGSQTIPVIMFLHTKNAIAMFILSYIVLFVIILLLYLIHFFQEIFVV